VDLGTLLKVLIGIVVAVVLIGGFVYAIRLNGRPTKDYGTESQSYNPPLLPGTRRAPPPGPRRITARRPRCPGG